MTTLTVAQIADLARFAGLDVDDSAVTDAGPENEITIADCPADGVIGDDGTPTHYPLIAYFSEYPEEGMYGIGEPIEPGALTPGAAAIAQAWASDALRDVAAERRRQIDVEGWTPEHDDEHTRGELVQAAAELCLDGTDFHVVDRHGDRMIGWGITEHHRDDRRCQLVIAGALILAEIERLDRAAG